MTTHNLENRRYDTIIFDLDGTLLDTLEDLHDAVNHIFNRYGYPLRSLEEIRTFVGNGIYHLIKRAIPEGLSEEEFQSVLLEYRKYYTNNYKNKTKPYEGIMDLLAYVKQQGYRTAIVSNKNDAAVKKLTEDYFADYIDVAVGQREGIGVKPAPDSVNEVMRLLHTDASKSVYVGDSEVDKATAENASMDYVLVDWGFRHREELEQLQPMKIVSHTDELAEYLMRKINQ